MVIEPRVELDTAWLKEDTDGDAQAEDEGVEAWTPLSAASSETADWRSELTVHLVRVPPSITEQVPLDLLARQHKEAGHAESVPDEVNPNGLPLPKFSRRTRPTAQPIPHRRPIRQCRRRTSCRLVARVEEEIGKEGGDEGYPPGPDGS